MPWNWSPVKSSANVLKAIHLAVQYVAIVLHTLIVAGCNHFLRWLVYQNLADGDASSDSRLEGLLIC